jgi:predicted membrane protein
VEDITMEKRIVDRRLWFGIIAIVAGIIFLANNFGVLDYQIRHYLLRWEVLLMALGLIFILGHTNRSTGVILFVIGGAFYLRDFFNYHFSFWQVFWPSLLILIGFMIIFRHKLDRDWRRGGITNDENSIDEVAILGGGDRVVTSQQFTGGKITTIFGGLNYNMLKAKLAPGDNYLDVFCLFGGMKLILPQDWDVRIRVMSLFGGFSDKNRTVVPPGAQENVNRLIIKGTVIFGGGEIKPF